ncbi:enoyl-ACP reductase FabI [Buchnera aphidicola]|uniref:enoyl-ACP reductase FabI n=1 Tax=Buchnera aphidicola TaxID=9 RepID=UPI00209338E1|nr:enoyl-ACP reductase [Buchnera aphidicola]USS94305.1 enoyl-ACP reductase [Buchnera aphidicola (Sipha maydis)]WII23855.1 enoyl-ACP reductase [Buchnera aphidicola (Sipha maydis)]
MSFLSQKKILIVGLYNKFSIAYGIAKSMHFYGAKLAFTYKKKKYENKIKFIAKKFNSNIFFKCNFKNDIEIKNLSVNLKKKWKKFDGIVHSIAFLKKKYFHKNYMRFINRKAFIASHEISSYSFVALAKYFKNSLNDNSSLLTVSYLGSKRFIPGYNFMALAKASLEANVRYMACSLGPKIRVNAISSGPIKTISSYRIDNFKKILSIYEKNSPIKRNISIREIGNSASFLISDLASGITGQVIYVDGGFNIIGVY